MNFSKKRIVLFIFSFSIMLMQSVSGQHNIYANIEFDEVEFSLKDFGSMWTFDDIPYGYFEKTYGFKPTDDWLERVQKAALQFGGGCSAAFVSADGLIMTNHHCGRGQLSSIQDEGEDWLRDGFYAESLSDERKVPRLFVDQLILIEDVTDEILSAMGRGKTDSAKVSLRDVAISEIVSRYNEESGLECRVVTLYNGGKFSLYGYKRYNDIRLVMAPDFQIAATGWDWDNFTYPRYELDFMFYRAYDENGEPVKSDYHFSWSEKGASEGEPIFVVGRPGNTDRLMSYADLEYFRDKVYPGILLFYNELYKVYYELFNSHPERESELLNRVMGMGNGRKSYAGRLLGLKDEYLMAKKLSFENDLRKKVNLHDNLKSKYSHIWDAIQNVRDEQRKMIDLFTVVNMRAFSLPVYFENANKLLNYAEQMKKPEDERPAEFKADLLEETKAKMFPEKIDEELHSKLMRAHANYITRMLGTDHELSAMLYGGLKDEEAVQHLFSISSMISKESFVEMLKLTSDEILNFSDPIMSYVKRTKIITEKLSSVKKELDNTLEILHQELGEVIFAVYGNQISPDATSTLRITDGVIAGYEYNGTIAPGKVTYYGLWDRYNSFDKSTYPWGLHERWKTPPPELNLSIPIGFASTNDIVGGNSGSSVINVKGEVVGLVHDGNLESLAGHFAFLPENNRSVATDSWGLMEALKYIYKTERLVEELNSGRISSSE